MQDSPQVGWDPISVNHVMPWQLRLYILYLFVVFGISLVRSLGLFRQLWSSPFGRRSRDKEADSLAVSGLTNRLPREGERESGGRDLSDQVQRAENRFLYLWEMCVMRVASMKRLVVLTLLFGALTFVSLVIELCAAIATEKTVGISVFAANFAELLTPLALGLTLCVWLYFVVGFYEGVLARRRTSWNYFCARMKNGSTAP